jgi:hypothetical protein
MVSIFKPEFNLEGANMEELKRMVDMQVLLKSADKEANDMEKFCTS